MYLGRLCYKEMVGVQNTTRCTQVYVLPKLTDLVRECLIVCGIKQIKRVWCIMNNIEEYIMQITRQCEFCNIEKLLEEFCRDKRCQLGRTWMCLGCKKIKNHQRYKSKGYCANRNDGVNLRFIGVVKSDGCSLCGFNKHPNCLDFHHINPKEKSVNIAQAKISYTLEKLIDEMKKCCLVCSNCHRLIHAKIITVEQLKPVDVDKWLPFDCGE